MREWACTHARLIVFVGTIYTEMANAINGGPVTCNATSSTYAQTGKARVEKAVAIWSKGSKSTKSKARCAKPQPAKMAVLVWTGLEIAP